MSSIARATGLGRSSLYHYFPGGKHEMALAVLDHLEGWFQRKVVEPLAGSASAERRIDALLTAVDEIYEGGRASCLLERLVASVESETFRVRLASIFSAWTATVAEVISEVGVPAAEAAERAEDAIARIQGALVVCAATGTTGAFARALVDLRADLLRESRGSVPA